MKPLNNAEVNEIVSYWYDMIMEELYFQNIKALPQDINKFCKELGNRLKACTDLYLMTMYDGKAQGILRESLDAVGSELTFRKRSDINLCVEDDRIYTVFPRIPYKTVMIRSDISADNDGIDHINVYSKGSTNIGRLLSNFAYTPFLINGHRFASVEAYWYYYTTGQKYDHLKSLYGFKAKLEGKKYERVRLISRRRLFNVYLHKIAHNKDLYDQLMSTEVPFTHYYNYKDYIVQKLVWTGVMWNDIKSYLNTENGKNYIDNILRSNTDNKVGIEKIISGGQTGADIAGIDAAIDCGVPYGGWLPKGRKTENGPLSDKYTDFKEMSYGWYPERTEQNVIDSDGTVIFTYGKLSTGSGMTMGFSKRHNRPCLHIDLNKVDKPVETIKNWINDMNIKILNIAGRRYSKSPDIYSDVKRIITDVLR